MKKFFKIAAFFWACTFIPQAPFVSNSPESKRTDYTLLSGPLGEAISVDNYRQGLLSQSHRKVDTLNIL